MTSGRTPRLAEMDDADLVGLVAGGDRGAFTVLMERHQDLVFGVALRLMGNREAALDAVQETFITLFRKADRFRAEAAFTTWLYRVTTNTCYDLLRKQRRRHADPLPEHHDPIDARSNDQFTSVELRPAVESALTSISPEFRAAVVLSDLEGLSMEEIARVLQIPIGTAKSRLFRGRRLLAERLGNLLDTNRPLTDDA